MDQFLTFLVHLAFFRENPRYMPELTGAPKLTQETVPLLQCVKNMLSDALPRMRTGDPMEYRKVGVRACDVLRKRCGGGGPPPSRSERRRIACQTTGATLARATGWLALTATHARVRSC